MLLCLVLPRGGRVLRRGRCDSSHSRHWRGGRTEGVVRRVISSTLMMTISRMLLNVPSRFVSGNGLVFPMPTSLMFTVVLVALAIFDHARTFVFAHNVIFAHDDNFDEVSRNVVEQTSSTRQESSRKAGNYQGGDKVGLKPKEVKDAIEAVMDAVSSESKCGWTLVGEKPTN